MDQHRNVLAIDGRAEDAWIDAQTESQQLQHQNQLHKTVDRLHALLPEYEDVVRRARRYLEDTHVV